MLTSFDHRAGLKAHTIQFCERRMSRRARGMASPTAVVAMIALAWSSQVCADAEPLTLEGAVELALRTAPQIAAAKYTIEAAQSMLPGAGRLPYPEFVAAVDNLPVDTADRYSFSRDFMTMRRIGLMQAFPNHRKRRLQSQLADQGVAIAGAELRESRFETARATSEAWIALAVAEESSLRLRELKPEAELQATAVRAALENGRASAMEALAAQSLVAQLDERIRALDQEIEGQRAELARWIGDAAERPLASMPTDFDLGYAPEVVLQSIALHAPLAPTIARLDAAKTDVALARAEKRPDWSAELSYQKRGDDFSDMISLEFRVGLPFAASRRQDSAISGKLSQVRAQEAERDAEILMHTTEVRRAQADWRIGSERLQHYTNELLPLARDRTRAAVASYGSGRGDLRGTFDALSEEIDAQLGYLELEGGVARAWAFLHLLHDSGVSP
jgi:outer membrane protein TolC